VKERACESLMATALGQILQQTVNAASENVPLESLDEVAVELRVSVKENKFIVREVSRPLKLCEDAEVIPVSSAWPASSR
jgi:hypothetical protein